jgi:hypothetical protein
VKLCKDGVERFLDASGVWTLDELLRRLAQEYQYDAYVLLPWENVALTRMRVPFDGSIAQSVEKALVQALGSFPPACVFPLPELVLLNLAKGGENSYALSFH